MVAAIVLWINKLFISLLYIMHNFSYLVVFVLGTG